MGSVTALPIVDLNADADTLRASLRRAAHEVGFPYLVGHDVPSLLVDGVLEAARRLAYFFNPALQAQLPVLSLPAGLAERARPAPDPSDPIHSVYGRNAWKSRVRAHPDVAAAHGFAPGRLESENPVLGSRSE